MMAKSFTFVVGMIWVLSMPMAWASAFLSVEADVLTKVFVNGKLLGETPLTEKPISAGSHQIRYVNEDAKTQMEFSVNLSRGRHLTCTYRLASQENSCTQVSQVDSKPKGKVTFLATPPATVFVNGKRLGETPLQEFDLEIGTHNIEFRLQGFEPLRETIELGEHESKRLSVEFESTEIVK